MGRLYIGLDTSCYTTSVACVDDENIILNERTMLDVRLIQNAANKHGIFDVLLAGGVASSSLLKTMLGARLDGSGTRLYFAQTGMSGDNAAGNAVLAREWAASRLLKQSSGGVER